MSTGPQGESEPFFARLSDTWIEGVGRVELTMEFLDNRLGFDTDGRRCAPQEIWLLEPLAARA